MNVLWVLINLAYRTSFICSVGDCLNSLSRISLKWANLIIPTGPETWNYCLASILVFYHHRILFCILLIHLFTLLTSSSKVIWGMQKGILIWCTILVISPWPPSGQPEMRKTWVDSFQYLSSSPHWMDHCLSPVSETLYRVLKSFEVFHLTTDFTVTLHVFVQDFTFQSCLLNNMCCQQFRPRLLNNGQVNFLCS